MLRINIIKSKNGIRIYMAMFNRKERKVKGKLKYGCLVRGKRRKKRKLEGKKNVSGAHQFFWEKM